MDTKGTAYTERLRRLQSARWKRLLPVQAVYQWNVRRYDLGRTLDVGCGLGRNLSGLPEGSIGVDHNADSIAHARSRGLEAYTTDEFLARADALVPAGGFDALLVAHVIEHLSPEDGQALMESYLPYLRPGGKVLFICPQERGYASDPTHVRWTSGDDLEALATACGLRPGPWRSFPFPRRAGRVFTYNEWVVCATKS